MLGIPEIKVGRRIVLNGEPYAVVFTQIAKAAQSNSYLRTKLKNLITGAVLEKTFNSGEKAEEADISKSQAQYLYQDGDEYYFMDSGSYDQFFLSRSVLGESTNYLVEGTEVTVLNFNGQPINVELPIKMRLKVVEAPPGIKGNTASAGDKQVTLETGMKITTPLFVNEGDEIIVNTERGEYVSRA